MRDSIAILAEHVASTLPDSLSKRRELLNALHAVLKPTHPARKAISAQLDTLDDLEKLQRELPLNFTLPENKSTKPQNGDRQ